MARAKDKAPPPISVLYGEEEHPKLKALQGILEELLPPEVDRSMALAEYDGSKSDEQGGPTLASVMDDLMTLPFLAPRRVVIIRDADKFVTAHRTKLEQYLESPSPTGSLVLVCRTFTKTTKLYKAAKNLGGHLIECKRLSIRESMDYVIEQGRERDKRIDATVAARLVELIGHEQGLLTNEVEKLCLYALDRAAVTMEDLDAMVGMTREEKIFAAMDAAAAGNLSRALELWRQVTATDKDAVYKALGGMAYKVRGWLTAHQMAADGIPLSAIAPKVGMWKRDRDLAQLLKKLDLGRTKRILAQIGELDTQAKMGLRSIDNGVEDILAEVASPVL